MQGPKQQLLRAYFSVRNSWPVWYGILSLDARRRFANTGVSLNASQQNTLNELLRDGIAFTDLETLFPNENMLETLQKDMQSRDRTGEALRKKAFLKPFWDDRGEIDLSNPFFALSLRPTVLDIVNSYDNMFRRLNYLTLAETIPVGDAKATASQRWHRDPEEKRMVKMFIYLNDVDEEAGPFTYVKQSQYGSPVYGSLFPQKLPLGNYPPDGAVDAAVKPDAVVSATGKAGTVIFCDTAGLHRGGYAKSKPRYMFTAFYPSAHWTEPMQHSIAQSVKDTTTSPQGRYAIYLN